MQSKKAAIDLSMNMLVILLISIVILAGGIGLLYKFIGGAEDIKSELDQKTSEELERLLVDQGKQVALPLHVANIDPGGKHVFGLGILNVGGIGNDFLVTVTPVKIVDEKGDDITDSVDTLEVGKWPLYERGNIAIQENEHHKEAILLSVPKDAAKGQYLFSVKVLSTPVGTPGALDGSQYGNTQKIIVNVR